ncbi:HD domain-containing protein [Longitalea arenae]|uniref:HD domain-containing protein n=1 Tax=Longitalea arenae TaxID=2812558 RepID=UPI0019678004|nr:hypothetical protein [Longitalea arenae]
MVIEKANSPVPNKVRAGWDQLTAKYAGGRDLADRFFQEIVKKYTSSRRHYHNLQHIQALLEFCEIYAAQLNDRDVVEFAIFYHDIIYNVLRKDNELRSAGVAVKRLEALKFPADKMEQVKIYIEATKTHALTVSVTHPRDLQFFLDFDMSILAADLDQYEAYARQVRREYRIYPDNLYYPGRKQFLQSCLAAEHIFQTAIFQELYEAKARTNMARELDKYGL